MIVINKIWNNVLLILAVAYGLFWMWQFYDNDKKTYKSVIKKDVEELERTTNVMKRQIDRIEQKIDFYKTTVKV